MRLRFLFLNLREIIKWVLHSSAVSLVFVLTIFMLSNYNAFVLVFRLFPIFFFDFFQECYQSVKHFGSRSELTFCQSWSGYKLFAKTTKDWSRFFVIVFEEAYFDSVDFVMKITPPTYSKLNKTWGGHYFLALCRCLDPVQFITTTTQHHHSQNQW